MSTPTNILVKKLDTVGSRVIVSVDVHAFKAWEEDIKMRNNAANLRKQFVESMDSGISELRI